MRIARERFSGPVEVFAMSKVSGVEIAKLEIADGAKEASLPFQVADPAVRKTSRK